MRTRIALLTAICALAGGLLVAGCGSESEQEELEAAEGQHLEIGGLIYNVAITRFLNPDDTEDAEYLVGQDPPEPGQSYLGVFLTVVNRGEDPLPSADGYVVASSGEARYLPLASDSPYALEIGTEVLGENKLPIPDSTAATGPIEGAMLVFLVDDAISESRPLRLEIESGDETGEVELDI